MAGLIGMFSFNVFYLLIAACLTVHGLEEFIGSCGLSIDLMNARNVHSGILTMPLPQTMSKFQDPARPINCEVLITFPSATSLLIELYFLDIMPRSGDMKTCTTGLEIFDQTGRKYYGSRICMEGWQWEERHREKQQEKHLVLNSPLTLRLVSTGPYRGEGFKLHFNQLRPHWPCYIQEFKCQQVQRCVHDDLMCDGWDDCGDYSDERIEAGCTLLSASEICSIIMGIIILIGAGVEVVMFVSIHRRFSQDYGLKTVSKISNVSDKNNMDPVFGVGQQVPLPSSNSKSAVPSKRRQESESDTIDKLDLEKADRYIKKAPDDMSERSFHSNERRNRAHSPGADVPLSVKRSGRDHKNHKGRSSSQSSLNHKRVEPVSGIDNPALENNGSQRGQSKGREGMSGRDRDSLGRDGRYGRGLQHSSDSDSYDDRDKYKGSRRRSSQERRREVEHKRNYRYSDEDSEYERGRDHRRRRRSYDTYSDDSDYERDRRRRSRERHSRERYTDDDSDRDRFRKRDEEKDKDQRRISRDSFDRDRSYERDRRSPYGDGDDERPIQQRRRSGDRRYSPSADRDRYTPSKKETRSWENIQLQEKYRESPPLPLPPPYSEEDTQSLDEHNQKLPPPVKDVGSVDQKNKISPPSENEDPAEQQNWKQPVKELGDNDWRRSTNDRRERYSRNRWTPQKDNSQGSPPPEYRHIASESAHKGITYKEESV